MDISKLVGSCLVVLPLIFGLFLLYARIGLVIVNKKILNFGLLTVNFINILISLFLGYFVCFEKLNINYGFDIFNQSFYDLNFTLNLNSRNMGFLLISSVFYFAVCLFLTIFFKQKKQFLFTKQRFYIILSFLIFNTNLFLMSNNILLTLILWMLQSVFLFVFIYFDIFKKGSKTNIIRFLRIELISDFALFATSFILYKYYLYTNLSSFSLFDIKPIFEFMLNNGFVFEAKLLVILLLIVIFSKLAIFPFSCRYSFLVNSSEAVYLPVLMCVNNILGSFLVLNTFLVFDEFFKIKLLINICLILTVVTSLIFLFYEKNIKIIFGYILTVINSLFIYFVICFENTIYLYYLCLFIMILILSKLLLKDRINIQKRIINKFKGFYLERLHIFSFEILPRKIANLFVFLNDLIFKPTYFVLYKTLNFIAKRIYFRYLKSNKISVARNIFLVFSLFIIFIILSILFTGVDFG